MSRYELEGPDSGSGRDGNPEEVDSRGKDSDLEILLLKLQRDHPEMDPADPAALLAVIRKKKGELSEVFYEKFREWEAVDFSVKYLLSHRSNYRRSGIGNWQEEYTKQCEVAEQTMETLAKEIVNQLIVIQEPVPMVLQALSTAVREKTWFRDADYNQILINTIEELIAELARRQIDVGSLVKMAESEEIVLTEEEAATMEIRGSTAEKISRIVRIRPGKIEKLGRHLPALEFLDAANKARSNEKYIFALVKRFKESVAKANVDT